jgi:hypothetical protein
MRQAAREKPGVDDVKCAPPLRKIIWSGICKSAMQNNLHEIIFVQQSLRMEWE